MSKDLGLVNPEQQRTIAVDIYSALQLERGITSLSGFNHGEVIRADIGKRIQNTRLSTNADFEKDLFGNRGFTEDDINSGITAIIEYQFLNPDWPVKPFVQEPILRYLNVAGTGKVVEGGPDQEFEPSVVEPYHIDALRRTARLSIIPRQIIEIFGTYEEFLRQLGDRDMTGIDSVEDVPSGILYNGGLKSFVKALRLKETGELEKLDTSLHALKDSLDKRDHFTKLLETLNRLQS